MEQWTPPTPEELAEIRRAEEIARRAREEAEADKRRSVRLALHANVTARSETNFFTGFTENLSEGGVFVATLSPPPVGERVLLQISVDGGEPVACEGEVRWIRTDEEGNFTGCGIQFVNLDPDAAAAIARVYKRLSRDPLLYL